MKKRFSTLTKAAQELGERLRDKMTHWLWSGDRNRIQETNSLRKTTRVESCVRWKGLRFCFWAIIWLRTVIFLILLYNFNCNYKLYFNIRVEVLRHKIYNWEYSCYYRLLSSFVGSKPVWISSKQRTGAKQEIGYPITII